MTFKKQGGPSLVELTTPDLCVIMLDMKTASVREVQHNLNDVLAWVAQGEEVQITRRNKPVAKIAPIYIETKPVQLPDFAGRSRAIWGDKLDPKPLSAQIIDERIERQ